MADWHSFDSNDAAWLTGDTGEPTYSGNTALSGAEQPSRPMNCPAPRLIAIPSFSSFTRLSPPPPDFGDSSNVNTGTTTGMTSLSSVARVDQSPNSADQDQDQDQDRDRDTECDSPLHRLLSSSARQVRGRRTTFHTVTAQGSTFGIVFSTEALSATETASRGPGEVSLSSEYTSQALPESWLRTYSGALTQPGLRGALTEIILSSIDLTALPTDETGGRGCFSKEATRETELLTRVGDRQTVRVSALRNSAQGDRGRILVDFDPGMVDRPGRDTVW